MQRGLIRLAQGLAIVTEITALLVLFPMFKAWSGQAWLVLTFSCFLPGMLVMVIVRGAMPTTGILKD